MKWPSKPATANRVDLCGTMMWQLTLYTREGCGLCEEMKAVIRKVGEEVPLQLGEVDVDGTADLKEKLGHEVPVLFINGRKAFKYRLTARDLRKRLAGKSDRRIDETGSL